MKNRSFSSRSFNLFNYSIMIVLCLLCVLPFVHILALSLSSNTAVMAGRVGLWPVDFTTASYKFLMSNGQFFAAMFQSAKRAVIGTMINTIMCIITAYPLSKTKHKVIGRNIYMTYIFITMLIGGGMIPTYLLISKVGLMDSFWALVLPGALPIGSMLMVMNFIRNLPGELEEAAFVDGAGPFKTLWIIMVPLLKPVIATIVLFAIIGHWNAWFDATIYLKSPSKYPLQAYMRMLLKDFKRLLEEAGGDMSQLVSVMDARTGRSAQIFLAALPIMCVYPFLQKYFTKGLVLGSVKG